MSKLASIIIPTYNRADEVVEALDSALAQDYPNFEVIVVDDGSTDDTRECLQVYIDRNQIKYVYKDNGGCASARNEGLRHATGGYIAFLDSDDILKPDFLSKSIAVLERMPEDVGAVFSDYERMLESGSVMEKTLFQNADFVERMPAEYVDERFEFPEVLLLNRDFYRHQVISSMVAVTAVIKRSVYEMLEWYDESLRCCQDWEFLTRMTKAFRVACLNEPTEVVRFCVEGITHRISRQCRTTIEVMRRFLKDEAHRETRARIKGVISESFFKLAYDQYKQGHRWNAVSASWGALWNGYSAKEAVALMGIAVVPTGVAKWLKRVNPLRGKLGV